MTGTRGEKILDKVAFAAARILSQHPVGRASSAPVRMTVLRMGNALAEAVGEQQDSFWQRVERYRATCFNPNPMRRYNR